MAKTSTPGISDRIENTVYKWGGIAIVIAVIALIVAYVLSVAVSLLVVSMRALTEVAGSFGLIAIGCAIGGAAVYTYLKRGTP